MATKLQMAKFLRDSIKESKTVEKPTEEAATVAEFASFFKKAREYSLYTIMYPITY
jgi:hypothetical protein